VIQKYLNFQFAVSMDLFGSEQSTNAGTYYTSGLKGRWGETRRKDDHQLLGLERQMNVVRDGEIVQQTVPLVGALNLDLRDEYVADCHNGVRRWNQALEDAGLDERLTLPHEGFFRKVGAYAGTTSARTARSSTQRPGRRGKATGCPRPRTASRSPH
jgi:benzoyl-CoA 2,3-dioxygenase component B